MAPDTFLDAGRPREMRAPLHGSCGDASCLIETLSDRSHSLRIMLSRQLRFAEADYRRQFLAMYR